MAPWRVKSQGCVFSAGLGTDWLFGSCERSGCAADEQRQRDDGLPAAAPVAS